MKNPFLYYTSEASELLKKAKSKKDKGYWLYTHKFRNTLFFLEALCRLFSKTKGQDKDFLKWKKAFKEIEDQMGEIDFYDVAEKEFKQNKKVPEEILSYLKVKRDKSVRKFEENIDDNWLDLKKIGQFEKFIQKQKLTFDEDLISKLENAMRKEWKDTLKFARSFDYEFTKVDRQLHELRRNIRWMSIYAEALRGVVKLDVSKNKLKWYKTYVTKEVLSSPFVKFPIEKRFPKHIHYDANSFYALSWMIAELGILKDQALKIELLSKALFKTEVIDKEKATKKAESMLKKKTSEKAILKKASVMAEKFFHHHKATELFAS